MKMFLDIQIPSPENKIDYPHHLFLIGSCFTEHIGNRLAELKFPVLQNPNGILFDPLSVSNSLRSYIDCKQYTSADLFQLNELWQSWHHHSMFSGLDQEQVLTQINEKQKAAHRFLGTTDWLIITLGSSFSYQLKDAALPVANCHRAPAQWFKKNLLETGEITAALGSSIEALLAFNPELRIIMTVSPVRHIRDGVIENNRSKARLIEAVHQLVNKYNHVFYFPAYELVIDVLRDYRFYDVDLVHPNYAATEFVFEKFTQHYISQQSFEMMEDIRKFITAFRHKPFQPHTSAHKQFLKNNLDKILQFQEKHPHLDFSKEINYFSKEVSAV
jgi:hypothetical protein